MDISEQVLSNTLAQLLQKERRDASKKPQAQQEQMQVVPPQTEKVEKVNVQF